MNTDYESTQSVEVYGPEGTGGEVSFTIGLTCTAKSFAGCFDPRIGGEPPSGPEFDLTTVAFDVAVVNYKGGVIRRDTMHLSYDMFAAVVGREVADKVIERAEIEAAETGDF